MGGTDQLHIYRKSIKNDKREINNFLDIIKGVGITTQDIVEYDKYYGDKLREKIGKKEELTQQEIEDRNLIKDKVVLIIKSEYASLQNPECQDNVRVKLNGTIKDIPVKIKCYGKLEETRPGYSKYFFRDFEGSFDNKKITDDEAKEIFDKYFGATQRRFKNLEKIKEEKKNIAKNDWEKAKEQIFENLKNEQKVQIAQ